MTNHSYSFEANEVPHHYNKPPQLTLSLTTNLNLLIWDHHLQLYFISHSQKEGKEGQIVRQIPLRADDELRPGGGVSRRGKTNVPCITASYNELGTVSSKTTIIYGLCQACFNQYTT